MGALSDSMDSMIFYDAHCHLQDQRIASHFDDVLCLYEELGVAEVVVNGTGLDDWDAVAEMAQNSERVRPSFGLHPWKVNEVRPRWRLALLELWDYFPEAGVGEIGLDRWIEGHDLSKQEPAFLWQLRQAVERELPVSIHCVRAWGRMQELLVESPRPDRGFLLHSYGGPSEMVEPMAKLGAYFSVSGYFENEGKEKKLAALRKVPLDRLLVETDAPDMRGPLSDDLYRFEGDGDLNHPANIVNVYRFVARLFEMPVDELVEQVAANYRRLFAGE